MILSAVDFVVERWWHTVLWRITGNSNHRLVAWKRVQWFSVQCTVVEWRGQWIKCSVTSSGWACIALQRRLLTAAPLLLGVHTVGPSCAMSGISYSCQSLHFPANVRCFQWPVFAVVAWRLFRLSWKQCCTGCKLFGRPPMIQWYLNVLPQQGVSGFVGRACTCAAAVELFLRKVLFRRTEMLHWDVFVQDFQENDLPSRPSKINVKSAWELPQTGAVERALLSNLANLHVQIG